ncbi:hypothetical protein [Pseudomonas sp. SO81]|jgi:hypothetical protein|uniref:hypothetical protein n=1 Tax=Pseudomonas sp. SO81 TaxID=2983246 RepID=UPI0025A453D0|nr:hypothetical protein [Pseudomonas sp. SO81]
MTTIFNSSADPNEIVAEVLSNGIAGIRGAQVEVQDKVAVVRYLVDLLERSASTLILTSALEPTLVYVYDSDAYEAETARRLVEGRLSQQ